MSFANNAGWRDPFLRIPPARLTLNDNCLACSLRLLLRVLKTAKGSEILMNSYDYNTLAMVKVLIVQWNNRKGKYDPLLSTKVCRQLKLLQSLAMVLSCSPNALQ